MVFFTIFTVVLEFFEEVFLRGKRLVCELLGGIPPCKKALVTRFLGVILS